MFFWVVRKRKDVSRFAAIYNNQRSKLLLFKFTRIVQPDCFGFIQFRYLYLYAKQHFLVKLIIFRHITCITHFCTVLRHVSDVKWQVGELLEAQGLFKCTCWQHMTWVWSSQGLYSKYTRRDQTSLVYRALKGYDKVFTRTRPKIR